MLTGELSLATTPTTHVYLRDGQVYFAERTTDGGLGVRLLVEGVITRECTEKGCWMQVAPSTDANGMRVTFKDYAFFIPQSMIGRRARMQGVTKVTTHTKASADHLISEGANLTRNADGTATEVAFEASGVELHR